jgi:hypothetical protein
MAGITTAPFTLKDTSLTLKLIDEGGTATVQEYRCQLTEATWVPSDASTSSQELVTFCTTHSDSTGGGNATWVLQLAGFQSFSDSNDLALFLFENEGEKAEATLLPGQGGATVSATNPGFKGTVTLKPVNIGGTARQFATFTVSLPADTKPSKVTSAA